MNKHQFENFQAKHPVVALRPIVFAILVLTGQVAMFTVAQADGIVVDQSSPTSQQPMVTNTASGITQVNIQAASAAGVSRNAYSQFDVSQQGVILNNSITNVQTQLGGFVQGNPYLGGGTARVILNEVNSSNPSFLNGYIEVAGSPAQVVIANPAGISCDGCGFINANRATLTTGTPIMNSGNLIGYRVGGGAINFQGAGLDTTQTNYTDVIARAVQVNAGIFANTLNVVTGTNQVNVDSASNPTTATAIAASSGSTAPAFAVDVAALGGMYAGKIYLIGTEAGVGVRNAGTLGAAVGEITVGLNGTLNNTGAISSKTNVAINSTSLDGSGSLAADQDIAISLTSDYGNVGSIQAGNNLSLQTTGRFTNHSILVASNRLELNAQNVDNALAGQISAFVTQLNVTGTLTNDGLIDGSDTFIQAGTLANSGSIFGDHLALSGNQLDNTSGGVIAARNKLDIGVSDIENRSSSVMFSAGDINIGGALNADRMAMGSATSLINENAIIEALGNVILSSTSIQNLNGGLQTELVVDESHLIREIQGEGRPRRYDISFFPTINNFNIEDQVQVNANGQVVDSFDDYTYFQYTATTRSTHLISSLPGQILSGGDMAAIAGNLTNSDSRIIAGGALDISGANVNNLETPGQQITSYSGFQQFRDWDGNDEELEFGPQVAFNPASSVIAVNLAASQLSGNINPTGSGTVVAGITAPLPGNSLFQPNPDVTGNYLIETDPRFANYRTWLSSDYMLQQLQFDPAVSQKRLGDGFYEQRLIREQVNQLTGRRFLTGYYNDETQYQALMNAGITVASSLQLTPGIALTATQAAQLTSDIVWLTQQEVTVADGSKVMALVPQVYVKMNPSDLAPSSGMMTGNTVQMNVSKDINNGGTIAGRSIVNLTAENVNILGGTVDAEINKVSATKDINLQGGTLRARDALLLEASRDLNVASTTRSNADSEGLSSFSRTNIDRVAGLYVTNPDAILVASAGNDVNLMAAVIQNQGTNGITQISAGKNLMLETVGIAEQNNSIRDGKNFNKSGSTQEIGTIIATSGDVVLNAGKDITAKAASVNSTAGDLNAVAGGNIAIVNGIDTYNSDVGQKSKRSGTFSSRTRVQRDTFNEESAASSSLSANTITLQAGQAGSPADAGNISVKGSNVVSTNGSTLVATNNISIVSAETNNSERHEQSTKKSGLSSSGASISYGTSKLDINKTITGTRNTGSTVGSTDGDVTINAGNAYTQTGSDVLAPQSDINITAQQVDINAAYNTSNSVTQTKFKQTGITLAISNPVISAIQTAGQMKRAASETSDPRMQTLAAVTTGLAAKNAYDAVTAGAANGSSLASQAGGVNISLSIGTSKSSSKSTQTSDISQSSQVIAGGDITINAISTGSKSDINVIGSQIKAGDNVTMKAKNQINLIAAENVDTLTSKNKSSSAGAGVSYGTSGLLFNASTSGSKGKANGQDVTWTESIVQGGGKVAMQSGSDLNLIGAQVHGNQVIADVGTSGTGNLHIQSLQDTSNYQNKQQSSGGNISVGAGKASGSISSSSAKANSSYAAVNEQSGIYAGDEGFQVKVDENTSLNGAVIASSQVAVDKHKNSLSTESINVANIKNRAEYSASSESSGVALSYDGAKSVTKNIGNNLVNASSTLTPGLERNGEDNSVTHSAISEGAILITHSTKQQEMTGQDAQTTIASINRDTANVNTAPLAKPDVQTIQHELQVGNEIISAATSEVVLTINNYYEKRIAEYDEQYKQKIESAQTKEAQAKELTANGDTQAASKLISEAQSLRAQAVDIRNERDNPTVSQGLTLALGSALISGLGAGQVDIGNAATTYSIGTLGDKFLLVAQKRDSDVAQGFIVTCNETPVSCAKKASDLQDINNPDVPLEQRIQELRKLQTKPDDQGNTKAVFQITIVDSNSAGDKNVAVNGILNEPDRAMVLAIGHLRGDKKEQSLYLSYNDTQGGFADLLNAAIDKYTDSSSNPSLMLGQALIDAKNGDDNAQIYLYAHSGGTLISTIALNNLGNSGQTINGLHVDYFGPAASISSAAEAAINAAGLSNASKEEKLNWLQFGNVNGLPLEILQADEKSIQSYININHGVSYYNHSNDPVATFVGGNFGATDSYQGINLVGQLTGSESRNTLLSIMEIKALLNTNNSAHSTYRWNDPKTWPTQPISPVQANSMTLEAP